LLLDTHYVLMLAGAVAQVSLEEQRTLESPVVTLCVSDVSIWEIAIKWRKHYRHKPGYQAYAPLAVQTVLEAAPITWLAIQRSHLCAEPSPLLANRDPFDELLIAQAQIEGMRLLTRDTKLLLHPVAVEATHVVT
jgi:PIN domain nuclease of toxin-antitoxin system